MTLTALELAASLDTTIHVIYRLADEHRFVPLPQSLLLPLGHLDPVDRMVRFGISEVDAAIFLHDLQAELQGPPTVEEKLERLIENLDALWTDFHHFVSCVRPEVALPNDPPF